MKFITSNKEKIKEIKSILPDAIVVEGIDLQEVMSDSFTIIVYKAIEAGYGFVVEDTILKINGEEVVDIKWNQEDKLKNAKTATWIVSLGYNDNGVIRIYRGEINGIIVEPTTEGFGFDPYFLPDGSDLTLAELAKVGKKNLFSARRVALLNLKQNAPYEVVDSINIPPWKGVYQSED